MEDDLRPCWGRRNRDDSFPIIFGNNEKWGTGLIPILRDYMKAKRAPH